MAKKLTGITRRELLKHSLITAAGSALLPELLSNGLQAQGTATRKRIYIALDDHTDYMWTADEATYQQAFVDMIDYYLDLADSTMSNTSEHQSRFNCDGSFWMWTYERRKSPADFQRLINRIKSGHISVPLNAMVVCLGGAPAEAVLRGMYYPGHIERRHNLRFKLAYCIENQTLPYGLVSLFAGAGAEYSWKGICNCGTRVNNAINRQHEIYWWTGPDGRKMLMKWHSQLTGSNESIGGYAEARNPGAIVDYVSTNADFANRYPFSVIGMFGKGWDDLSTFTDEFVTVAKNRTNASRLVIVSNEVDFFEDFRARYGSQIPNVAVSFGNEWDLYCASLAEVSATVKRSVEKLRGAEALAALVSLQNPNFMNSRTTARDEAFMNLGVYWDHNWTADGNISRTDRANWQRSLASGIASYVDTLHTDAAVALGALIPNPSANTRFYVFNPLGWRRTAVADFPYASANPVHVLDVTSGQEVPSQFVTLNGQQHLRILAPDVPSAGYKTFEIIPGAGADFGAAATVNGGTLENDELAVTVAGNGAITSLIAKKQNNRQMAATIGGRTVNDLGAGSGTIEVENAGAVSVTLRVTSSGPLSHMTRVTLFRGLDYVDIHNTITQNFSNVRTWDFSFNIPTPDTWHEEVGAVIRAKLSTNGGHYSPQNARYDWLTLNHFADMSGGGSGITLSNADCYFMRLGNSTNTSLDTATARISVLAGGQVDGDNLGIVAQGGDSLFTQRFALRPHTGFDSAAAMRFALHHQNPMLTGTAGGGNFFPAGSFSLVSISNPNALLWALKPAEDGFASAGIIARVWNLGAASSAALETVFNTLRSARHTTHIETPLQAITPANNRITLNLAAQEMKTVSLVVNPTPLIPPAPPNAIAPANASSVDDRTAFTWSAVSGATRYEFVLDSVNPPNPLPVQVSGTSYTPPAPLLPGVYYWRVRTLRGSVASDWSSTQQITVFSSAASAPQLYRVDTPGSLLTWGAVAWASGYQVQIDRAPNFAAPLYDNNSLPANPPQVTLPTLGGGSYYWRVRARRPNNTWGAWSQPSTFIIPFS